jgi:two-component system OmpR family sensor kinase
VIRHRLPGGLRTQLALAIALVAAAGVVASFAALYSATGSRLQSQIDKQLNVQLAEWRQFRKTTPISSSTGLMTVAQRFIKAQRYHAEALIILVQVGRATVTNFHGLVAAEERREHLHPEAVGLLDAPLGLATEPVANVGETRVLSEAIRAGGRRLGTLRLASSLTPVTQAQDSLGRTFIFVGIGALALALLAGVLLASLIAAPLRRMARVAAAVDAGDLSIRAGPIGAPGEVHVLARAFDRMLDRLERTFKRQRDFVSDASHELRTPLTVLRAQVELLDRETDPDRRHAATALLLRRLDELDRLVGDMLTLASAESGQLIEPTAIDLSDFFEDLRRDLPLFGERDFRLQPVGGTLRGDPNRLTQVLRNLVRNAVAHTRPGDTISVEARAGQGTLELAVTDTGPGIPPDQLERIFERFYSVDGGRSRVTGGGGLGLAIARAIVEAHGGTLRAQSPPGQGATFLVELPGYGPPAD